MQEVEVQPRGEAGHAGEGARRVPPDLPGRMRLAGLAKLIVNPTSSSRREIALARQLVSIGRDPSNDVVLPDAMVSRRHAVIEFRGSQYFIRDCNSSNGSLVNGDRVSERNLRDGDLVAIGTARMLFKEELEAEDSAAKVVQHPSAPRLHCPTCQADYRKGDQFCRQCGASAGAAPAPARRSARPAARWCRCRRSSATRAARCCRKGSAGAPEPPAKARRDRDRPPRGAPDRPWRRRAWRRPPPADVAPAAPHARRRAHPGAALRVRVPSRRVVGPRRRRVRGRPGAAASAAPGERCPRRAPPPRARCRRRRRPAPPPGPRPRSPGRPPSPWPGWRAWTRPRRRAWWPA